MYVFRSRAPPPSATTIGKCSPIGDDSSWCAVANWSSPPYKHTHNWLWVTAFASLHTTDFDSETKENKPIVARWTVLGY